MKRIQSVPLVIGQFLEAVDEKRGIVGSTTGKCIKSFIPRTTSRPVPRTVHRTFMFSTSSSARKEGSCLSGSNHVVRILSTLDRELLKPSSSIALQRHSNALVDILPPEADSSISMLGADERPDVKYSDVGGLDLQKQEIREAVELPLEQVGCSKHYVWA